MGIRSDFGSAAGAALARCSFDVDKATSDDLQDYPTSLKQSCGRESGRTDGLLAFICRLAKAVPSWGELHA